MASQTQSRTHSSGSEQRHRIQDPAANQHALQSFINQSPVEGNVLITLPHANYDMAQGRFQAPIDTVDGQLYAGHTPAPAFIHAQGSGHQGHTQSMSHGTVNAHRRRKHRRQARQLIGIGEQFPQQNGTTSMLQQEVMRDLHNIPQQS